MPSLSKLLLCLASFLLVEAAPSFGGGRLERRSVGSTISTPTGTYQGKILSRVEQWQGIPYAQQPIGELRFASPQPLALTNDTTVQSKIVFGPRCGQYVNGVLSEECLNLNIYRPQGTRQTAGLPVMVYIFGGSFMGGGANSYKPTNLVLRSKAISKSVIIVTLDYRLGALGFLVSPELREQGALNLGLQDQAMAFQWVQDNIALFGGDPSKVTIFGQSAGAIAVSMHLSSIRPENSTDLFRAAILESGAPGTAPAFDYTSSYPAKKAPSDGTKYSLILASAGCSAVIAEEQLACLRNATAASILVGQSKVKTYGGFPYAPTVDGLMVPDLPSKLYSAGNLRRVPLIVGTNLDEGPEFVSSTTYYSTALTTDAQLLAWLGNQLPDATSTAIAALVRFYPSTQSYGSPYNTGNVKYLFKQFKRASSIFGDLAFEAPRRALLAAANQWSGVDGGEMPVWSYQFSQRSEGEAEYLGVSHGAEIPWVWSTVNATTPEQITLRNGMSDYWINFANDLNPNGAINTTSTTPLVWPAYEQQNKTSISFKVNATELIADTFRAGGISYINNNPDVFGQ
ncbi:Alpha/Beta hydrolase protein [Leucosporidium creatinivorum]|uniref:Carboxylic ester hydrolase n=1 Tax=Leucosporidium creatinivorum TaxID=106004 RepID=A0A1Y2G369_9BASI|nr:Alpha/Beta hydrolase protein [Leucosporidium creatinivorum]